MQIDSNRVFLNIPYDPAYENVFLGLLTALICLGRVPIIVAEIPDTGDGRLPRIHEEIRKCRVSLHDLSCVTQLPPRFNMPFELGVAWTNKRQFPRNRYEVYVFESKRHRIQMTLSDWNGIDPKIHYGTPEGSMAAILECLGRQNRDLSVRDVMPIYKKIKSYLSEIKSKHAAESIYSARIFREVVASLVLMAKDMKFLN